MHTGISAGKESVVGCSESIIKFRKFVHQLEYIVLFCFGVQILVLMMMRDDVVKVLQNKMVKKTSSKPQRQAEYLT